MRCSSGSPAGGHVGWGECEASPLVSIAAFVCPMSHGVCRPVGDSVLGQTLDGPADIARIAAAVEYDSMDLLQAAHTFSGVEIALWDLLGQARGEPVWRLLGYERVAPEDALRLAAVRRHAAGDARARAALARRRLSRRRSSAGARSGAAASRDDADHFMAAREGLGPDGILLVDVGQIFGEDVEARGGAPAGARGGRRASGSRSRSRRARYEAYGALAAAQPAR